MIKSARQRLGNALRRVSGKVNTLRDDCRGGCCLARDPHKVGHTRRHSRLTLRIFGKTEVLP